MYRMELLETVQGEIEQLEKQEPEWAVVEKLALLYVVEHNLCRRMGLEQEQEGRIGFSATRRAGGPVVPLDGNDKKSGMRELQGGNNRKMRELADSMTHEELANAIVGYGRSLSNNGSNGSYNRLYNEMRRYKR